jgi:hypothetical protein
MPAVPAPIVAAAPTARRLRPGLLWALIAGGVLLLVLVAGAVTAGVLLTRPTTPSDAGGTQPTDSLIPEGPVAVGMGVTITPAENWSAFAQGDDYVLLYSDDLVDYAGLDVTVSAAPPSTIEEASPRTSSSGAGRAPRSPRQARRRHGRATPSTRC